PVASSCVHLPPPCPPRCCLFPYTTLFRSLLFTAWQGFGWRVSRKLLIVFMDWVSKPSCPHDHAEPHPPCTTIRLRRSAFQPSDARSSPLRSTADASPRTAGSCCWQPPSGAWGSPRSSRG